MFLLHSVASVILAEAIIICPHDQMQLPGIRRCHHHKFTMAQSECCNRFHLTDITLERI